VLLDIRYLIELLRSALFSWTTEGCEHLLQCLGLQESSASLHRRDLEAPSGLRSTLHTDVNGRPIRIEFPFQIPAGMPTSGDGPLLLAQMLVHTVRAVLGEPTEISVEGSDTHFRAHWLLPMATIAVEAPAAATPVVVLAIAPPSRA
jgi:hypothetical protein